MTRTEAIRLLRDEPVKIGWAVGFKDLTVKLHNAWIREMICARSDKTLQAHRGSYKTTCVSIALACLVVLLPNKKIMFMRKTDSDVKEVIRQVQNILMSPYMQAVCEVIHGRPLMLTTASAVEVNTNLTTDAKGTVQLYGHGISGSLTGKHFDIIFTDDIVNVQDRISKAERDHTKIIYQELQNIKNRGGRIFNTGTPWHKEDCFCLMPPAERFDCYQTGLISTDALRSIQDSMAASLFAANYELRHIASDDVIFFDPVTGADLALAEQGICHIDAAYGGEDYTAFTVCHKKGGKYYIFGKLWRKHVDDCISDIIRYRQTLNAGVIYCEDNGDKGYLARDLRQKGERCVVYHESMNKFVKITSYLKAEWKHVVFVTGTDQEYINQICDYTETAEHDDAPDSLASIVRKLWSKRESKVDPASAMLL
nr:MAG TPA: Terminase large subunit [Caudoviricetes sp.]